MNCPTDMPADSNTIVVGNCPTCGAFPVQHIVDDMVPGAVLHRFIRPRGKHPLRSRTNWFGLGVIALGVLELVQDHLPEILLDGAPKANAWITIGVGAIVIVLRFVTKSGIELGSGNAAR